MNEETGIKTNEGIGSSSLLPSIVIQDPKRQSTFHVSPSKLVEFLVNPERLAMVNAGTVTFVISDEDVVEEVQPFVDPSEEAPSVLIQHRKEGISYFLTYDELKVFEVGLDFEMEEENTITFFIPFGWESIERVKLLRVAGCSFHPPIPVGVGFLIKNI